MRVVKKCWSEKIKHCKWKMGRYCCGMMKKAFNSDSVLHFSDGSGDFSRALKFYEGGLTMALAIDYDSDSNYESHVKIYFCPWCGERIE